MTSGGGTAGRPVVVIVDGYCSARHLPELFAERGYDCVHVQSAPTVPEHLLSCFRPEAYRESLQSDGSPERILSAVAELSPVALVAGTCGAVRTVDELSEALGLRGNGTRLGDVRRDRHQMAEELRAAGLHVPRQLLVGDIGSLLAWYGALGGPVTLETLGGAGFGPARRILCDNDEELVAAYRAFVEAGRASGGRAEALLAEEFLPGGRAYVNTVSLDGTHHVCDIWRVHPQVDGDGGGREAPGHGELLPRRGPDQERLALHALAALDVLGVRNGPAHVELAFTPEGPGLVTVRAHLCGGDLPLLVAGAVGDGQLEWTVDAYVAPERFRRRAPRDYRREGSVAFVRPGGPAVCGVTAGCCAAAAGGCAGISTPPGPPGTEAAPACG